MCIASVSAAISVESRVRHALNARGSVYDQDQLLDWAAATLFESESWSIEPALVSLNLKVSDLTSSHGMLGLARQSALARRCSFLERSTARSASVGHLLQSRLAGATVWAS